MTNRIMIVVMLILMLFVQYAGVPSQGIIKDTSFVYMETPLTVLKLPERPGQTSATLPGGAKPAPPQASEPASTRSPVSDVPAITSAPAIDGPLVFSLPKYDAAIWMRLSIKL